MNAIDKNLLFDMSYALMRRFAFIEVGPAARLGLRDAAGGRRRDPPASSCRCGRLNNLGPAIYVDAKRYVDAAHA